MAVIYELRGQPAAFSELGLNLYSGCAVGCRYCYFVGLNRVTWEQWTTDVQPRRNILFTLNAKQKKSRAILREIIVCPAADPYQSDEAARLTRKAVLILEQHRLRVQVLTVCGLRIRRRFRHFGANRWKYATQILFQSERLREQWEPGGAPIAERVQTLREAHAAGIYTWVKICPRLFRPN